MKARLRRKITKKKKNVLARSVKENVRAARRNYKITIANETKK